MKRYWLCKMYLFISVQVGKIYLETEGGLIDDFGMTRSAIKPSQISDTFRYDQIFEEISFNHYLKLLK